MDQGIVEYATQRIISFSNENEQPTVYATTRKNLTNVNLCLALFTQQVYHVWLHLHKVQNQDNLIERVGVRRVVAFGEGDSDW